jgi:hypothetical protein
LSLSVSIEDLNSVSHLTNLEKLVMASLSKLDDKAVCNYSTLSKLTSIKIFSIPLLSGFGLNQMLVHKEVVVSLTIYACRGISSEGFYCLSTLINLSSLVISKTNLDDIALGMVLSSCLFLEQLDIQTNYSITVEGLNNMHLLARLRSLKLDAKGDDWLSKLLHNSMLTDLNLGNSYQESSEGLALLSSLVNLSIFNGEVYNDNQLKVLEI